MKYKLFFTISISIICLVACNNPDKLFNYEIRDKKVTILEYIGEAEIVVVPKKIKGMPVTVIGNNAFSGSSMIDTVIAMGGRMVSKALYDELKNNRITSITLPDTIEMIGNEAFAYTTNLKNITIPNSVISIGDRAFSKSGITNIVIPNSVTTIGNMAFDDRVEIIRR